MDTETGSIMAIHPNRSGERQVLDTAEIVGGVSLVASPTWSPDGTKIAFMAGPSATDTHIYVVDSNGSGLTELTHGPADDQEPAWQPVPSASETPTASETPSPVATPRP